MVEGSVPGFGKKNFPKNYQVLVFFFPAYNDSKSIALLVKKAYLVGLRISNRLQVIVVDDGSRDDTSEVLNKLKLKYPDLEVISHAKNKGYGGALRSGFRNSKNEWVFYTDGDGQYNVNELIKLYSETLDKNIDVVNGYKGSRSDGIVRKILGFFTNSLLHIIYDVPIRDIGCDFRLIRNSKLKKITLKSDSGLICLELVLKLRRKGAKFVDIEVSHLPRKYGKSEFFNRHHLQKTLKDQWEFWKKTRGGKLNY